MKLKVENGEEIFNKWIRLRKEIEVSAMFINTHCAGIVQSNMEIEVQDLVEFKKICQDATNRLEINKNRIKELYQETITFIKKGNQIE
jgi:hypothetical protein